MNPALRPHAQVASARDAELTGKRVRGEGGGQGDGRADPRGRTWGQCVLSRVPHMPA